MAVDSQVLDIRVEVDSAGAIKDLRMTGKELDKLESSLGGLKSGLQKAFVPLTALNQGFELLSRTVGAFSAKLSGTIKAFADAEKEQLRLATSIQFASKRIKNSAESWGDYADSLERSVGVNADAIKGLTAYAIQLGFSEKQIKDLIDASVNLSVITGGDVNSSFQRLTKTYLGAVKGISLYAPEVKSLTKEQLAAGAAVEILATKFSKSASVFNTSVSGAIERLNIGMGDFTEAIGESIVKATDLDDGMRNLGITLTTVAVALTQIDFDALRTSFGELLKSLAIGATAIGAITVVAGGFAVAITKVKAALALLSAPIVVATAKLALFTAGITALVVAIDVIVRNFSRLGDIGKVLIAAFGSNVLVVVEKVLEVFEFLGSKIPVLGNQISSFFGSLRSKVASATDELISFGVEGADNLDFGFAGTVFKEVSNSISVFNKGLSDGSTALQKLGTESSALEQLEDDLNKVKQTSVDTQKALSGLVALTANLRGQGAALKIDLDTLTKGADEIEKIYITTLAQIDAEREKAILEGGNLKAIEEQAAKAVQLANEIRNQNQLVLLQKQIRQEQLENEKRLDDSLKQSRADRLAIDEQILRMNMSREEIVLREREIEMDRLADLEKELEIAGKLDQFARKELELRRKSVEAKADMPDMGAIQADVSSIFGGDLGKMLDPVIGKLVTELGATFSSFLNVAALVFKAPDLINAMSGFIDSIRTWPTRLASAVSGIVGAFGKLLTEFPQRLMAAIPTIIDSLIQFFVQDAPKLFGVIIEAVLGAVNEIIKKLPDIASAFVTHIITDLPKIMVHVAAALVKMVPQIIVSLVKAIPKIIQEIIKAVINGFKSIGSMFKNLFKGSLTDAIKSASKPLKKLFTGATSQLFQVADLMDTTKAEDSGKQMIEAIKTAGDDASKLVKGAWDWVYKNVMEPWANLFETTWELGKGVLQLIGKHLTATWELAKGIFFAIGDFFASIWKIAERIFEAVINSFKIAFEFIGTIFSAIVNAFKSVFEFVGKMFNSVIALFQALWNFVSTVFTDPIEAFENLWEDIEKIFDDIVNAFSTLGQDIWDGFEKAIEAGLTAVADIGDEIWTAFKDAWELGIKAITDLGKQVWDSFKGFWDKNISALADLGSKVWDWFKAAWNASIMNLGNLGQKVWDWFKAAWDAGISALANLGQKVWDLFKAAWSTGIDALANLGSKIWGWFKDAWALGISGLANLGSTIWGWFKTAWDTGISALGNLGSKVWDGFKAAWDKGIGALADIGGKIWTSVTKAFSGFGDFIKGLLDKINPANLLGKIFTLPKDAWGKGTVEKFIGFDFPFVKFASGGVVPGTAPVAGNNVKNDIVPALLSPGEVVIDREKMANPAVAKTISAIMGGYVPEQHFGGFIKQVSRGDVGGAISGAAKQAEKVAVAVGDTIAEGMSKIGNLVVPQEIADVFNALSKFVSGLNLVDMIKDPLKFVKKVVLDNLESFAGDGLRKIMQVPQFATGGMVTGPAGVDNILARLTPGEFVINKQAVNSIGAGALSSMNAGGGYKTQPPVVNMTVNMTLNSSERIDEALVRQRIMPTIKDELRKESLRGGFVIAAQGVRR